MSNSYVPLMEAYRLLVKIAHLGSVPETFYDKETIIHGDQEGMKTKSKLR